MADDGHAKRKFPYWSDVNVIHVKRQGVEGAEHAGTERTQPKVFEQPNLQYDNYGELRKSNGTDFSQWSSDQIKEFLDQRGGEYADCSTQAQLIERAVEVEINTGPAKPPAAAAAEEEEYDPLDAYMSDLATEAQAQAQQAQAQPAKPSKPDIACDDEYDIADFMMAKSKGKGSSTAAIGRASAAAGGGDSDDEVYAAAAAADAAAEGLQYDSDDNPVMDGKKRTVDMLPPLDHSLIEYEPFAKDFYEEGPELFAMDDTEVTAYRRELEMRVAGYDAPKPVKEFNQCGFDSGLMAAIKKAGYERPTAIQAQALPALLSGRDVLGIAKTGSGKTAAFVLPMLVHIMDQPELAKGAGPIGVIVAPTRELAEQIHKETRKFSKVYSLRVAAAIGGLSKYDQFKDLKAGSEVAVATPGRLIDLIKQKACAMSRVTYLVLDEADRMFDMGFEPQVRSIIGQIRPDRQTLLFSATMPRKIERLVADALTNPITITVGVTGVANADVRQEVAVLSDDAAKMAWLMARLPEFIDQGEVIVFAGQRAKVDSLVEQLARAGARAGGIHGDMDQHSRMSVLDSFRSGKLHVLVATDVAARGLDIKTLKTVVNYDSAKDIDTHIHRVGRTGRAGDKEGVAHTLLLASDARFAGQLVQSLALAGQPIPSALHDLALKDSHFKRGSSRSKGGKGRKAAVGGAGLGFGGSGGAGGSHSTLPMRTATGHTSFQELPGFSRAAPSREGEHRQDGHRQHEHQQEQGRSQAEQGGGLPLPPPPPMPSKAVASSVAEAMAVARAAAARFAAQAEAQGALPLPPPPPTEGMEAAQAMAEAQQAGQQGPGVEVPDTTAAVRAAMADQQDSGRQYVRNFHENRFRSAFVSSGTAGGTTSQGATIIAPKTQAAGPGRVLPPPPVPVSQRPMYLSAQAGAFGGARRGPSGPHPAAYASGGSGLFQAQGGAGRQQESTASYHNAPPPSLYAPAAGGAPVASAGPPGGLAAAIAAAQAIAARLAAQEPR